MLERKHVKDIIVTAVKQNKGLRLSSLYCFADLKNCGYNITELVEELVSKGKLKKITYRFENVGEQIFLIPGECKITVRIKDNFWQCFN